MKGVVLHIRKLVFVVLICLVFFEITGTNAAQLYWAQLIGDRIKRSDVDGTNLMTLMEWPVLDDPVAIALDHDNSHIYWAQLIGDRIKRANLDGSNIVTLLSWPVLDDPVDIALDITGGKIYWAQLIGDRIKRANLDGTNVETLLEWPILDNPVSIALDVVAGKIYWAQLIGDRIKRANLDGTNVETLLEWPVLDDPVAIALDTNGGKLYWAQKIGDRIKRADLNGMNVETLLEWPLLDDPVDIALDIQNGKLYWAQTIGDRIKRSDLNGANFETLLEWPVLDEPVSLAFRSGQSCSTADQCDDGLFCNGSEWCDSGICRDGGQPDCNDNITCTEDSCSLANNSCIHVTNDKLCDNLLFCDGVEVCNVQSGCQTGFDPCPNQGCDEDNHICVPLVCDPPIVEAAGCRYLNVTLSAGKVPVAIQVVGDAGDPKVSCVSLYVQADGLLGTTPVYQTPVSWGSISVRGVEIRPLTTYHVQSDCGNIPGDILSGSVSATTWRWGDVNLDTVANISDVLRIVDGWRGIFVRLALPCTSDADCTDPLLASPFFECNTLAGFCVSGTIESLDLIKLNECLPDHNVNITDVLADVDAWKGKSFPCASPCP